MKKEFEHITQMVIAFQKELSR